MIRLERFNKEKSLEFLKRGFEEANMLVSDDVLQKIYERVDGIVGWLTYFGCLIIESHKPITEAVDEVTERALKLVQKEVDEVFRRSRYYMHVLKAIPLGISTWSGIKRAVEAWLGRPLQNAQITRLLKTLVELSIVEKKNDHYVIADPLIAEYSRRL